MLGWNGMGDILVQMKMNNGALGFYGEALEIATPKNELSDPWICRLKKNMSDIYSEEGDLNQAKACYESALESCPSHTIFYVILCRANILQGKESVARGSFRRTQWLKPVLIREQMKVRSYEEYRRIVVQSVTSRSALSQPTVRPTRPAASNDWWCWWLRPVVAPIASVFSSLFGPPRLQPILQRRRPDQFNNPPKHKRSKEASRPNHLLTTDRPEAIKGQGQTRHLSPRRHLAHNTPRPCKPAPHRASVSARK